MSELRDLRYQKIERTGSRTFRQRERFGGRGKNGLSEKRYRHTFHRIFPRFPRRFVPSAGSSRTGADDHVRSRHDIGQFRSKTDRSYQRSQDHAGKGGRIYG